MVMSSAPTEEGEQGQFRLRLCLPENKILLLHDRPRLEQKEAIGSITNLPA